MPASLVDISWQPPEKHSDGICIVELREIAGDLAQDHNARRRNALLAVVDDDVAVAPEAQRTALSLYQCTYA